MTRRIILALPVVLALALGVVALVAVQGHTAAEPIYSVAQVQRGLARNPKAWVGRTVLVNGRARILLLPGAYTPLGSMLQDPRARGASIPLSWTTLNPMLGAALRVPWLRDVMAPRVGGIGVYRVRLLRRAIVVPLSPYPQYYPYTTRTGRVIEDEAVLVDGLN